MKGRNTPVSAGGGNPVGRAAETDGYFGESQEGTSHKVGSTMGYRGNHFSGTNPAVPTAGAKQSAGAKEISRQETDKVPTSKEGSRTNPKEKTILTETGKMVKLTPTQIHLSNGKGLDIILDDTEGIIILSNKMVNIRSNNTINIAGRMGIELVGMEKVQLKHKNSSVMLMEELVTIKGAEVRMQ